MVDLIKTTSSISLLILSIFFYQPIFLSAQNTDKLFTLLNADQTNIHFNNQLEDTKNHNILIYSNYYGGAGVGVGDLNNDGLADVFFAGNLVADQLYLNKGNFVFEDITKKAGIVDNGGWSSGVIMADVNGDGWLDIYVTRELYDGEPELRKNKLYLNNGLAKGDKQITFTESAAAYGIDNSERTRHATFLDFDKDGDLDLFLLNQPPNPGDYSTFYGTELLQEQYRPKLYENRGDTFVDISEQAGFDKTGFPNSVTASDLNGDGWTDLFVANDFWVGDWYYINNGNGTFTNKIQDYARHTSFSSMGIDAADINNDGLLDIGVVDMVAADNYRQKANMSGMNPAAFWKVVNDGDGYQYMFNMLHLNTGEGQLSDIAQMGNMANTDWSWSILMPDLDNDGWKDIYITNGLMRDIRNKDASKTFPKFIESALHKFIQENPNPENISVWDIVDINEALALVPSEKLQNFVFKNNGDLTFSKKTADWGLDQKSFSNGSAYADFDNDGDLDLIVNNINDKAFVYKNNTNEKRGKNHIRIAPIVDKKGVVKFGTKVWVTTDESTQFQEITGVRGMYSTSETVAHFGLGKTSKIKEIKIRWADGKEQLLKNVDANQTISVKYSNAKAVKVKDTKVKSTLLQNITEEIGLNHRHEENVFDDFKPQVLLPHKMSTFGPALATGDINGDGLDDFYIGGAAGKPASLYQQNTDGSFIKTNNPVFTTDKRPEDVGATFFDADGDKDLDLYVVSSGNETKPNNKAYQDRLYFNDGLGNFEKRENVLPDLKFCGSKVCPADFDKDGDIDLFVAGRHIPWAYPEPASSVLLVNEGGKFTDATSELAPQLKDIGLVNDAKWFDSDNDGWLDLILVGEWMSPTLIMNEKGQRFSMDKIEPSSSQGWWFSVETADMDGDGDEDIIAGNLGLNYKYKATESEPFEIYYYDFDDNNSKDVVLTYYNYGIQYPLRGKQCSSEQIPEISTKFKTYDIFASSNVKEIYGDDKLENALHYEATSFASTYFENLGDGEYAAHPLPQMAQLSSINDFIIDDFNGDSSLDILLAGNLYNAEVETTRNDAGYGLLLAGDGKGEFEVVNRTASGFFVPYNVKNMATARSRNGQLILVGCNDDYLRVFRNNDNNGDLAK